MPDQGQVAVAAYRVMRVRGLAGVTIRAVREMMKKSGVRAGSDRDLPGMIRTWKLEQEKLTELPPHIVDMAQGFAKTVWEIAFATVQELQLQRGSDDVVQSRPRRSKAVKGQRRIELLRKAVEFLLRPDARKSLVKEPLSGQEIFERLTDRQAFFTDEEHINRDLLIAAKNSDVLYRLRGGEGKWWRKDRPLPKNFSPDGRRQQKYVRRGTPTSATRTANELKIEKIAAILSKAGDRGMTRSQIADKLQIDSKDKPAFHQLLRNHPRAKKETRRFRKIADKFVINNGKN
jgi:hypothetical protein